MISNKYRNFVAEANENGSKSKTISGAIKFLIANRITKMPQKEYYAEWRYKRDQEARKSNPEAKAARDGYRRKNFLSKLNRREKKLLKWDTSSCDAVTRKYVNRRNINAELNRIDEQRAIANARPHNKRIELPPNVVHIPISPSISEKVGHRPIKRGKDWELYATISKSFYDCSEGYTEWKNGKPRNYVRAQNDTYTRSFVIIENKRTVHGIAHETEYTATLPDGYAFGRDKNGLKVYKVDSPQDDYHPSANHFLENGIEYVIDQIDLNAKRREEMRQREIKRKAKQAAEKAEMQGVYVCMQDSLNAGNCRVGTENFARRHNLDTAKHYPATDLYEIANGDAGRVRLAITAAMIRHRKDMKRGYCDL